MKKFSVSHTSYKPARSSGGQAPATGAWRCSLHHVRARIYQTEEIYAERAQAALPQTGALHVQAGTARHAAGGVDPELNTQNLTGGILFDENVETVPPDGAQNEIEIVGRLVQHRARCAECPSRA